MGQLRELTQQTKTVRITTTGDRAKVAGLCALVVCVVAAQAFLGLYALGHFVNGTAILSAALVLLVVVMAGYGTVTLIRRTLQNITDNSAH